MTRAYILIQTEVGRAGSSVAEEIANISERSGPTTSLGRTTWWSLAESENLDVAQPGGPPGFRASIGITGR